MARTFLKLLVGIAILALSACAHAELTAPCSAKANFWSGAAFASSRDCGPMRPVN